MNWFVVSFFVQSFIIPAFPAIAKGVECYQCQLIEKYNGRFGEKSCMSGRTPSEELLVECPHTFEDRNVTCGKMVDTDEDGDYRATFRGCILNPKREDSCDLDPNSGFIYVAGRNYILNSNYTARNSRSVSVCGCLHNKCNSGFTTIPNFMSIIVAFFIATRYHNS